MSERNKKPGGINIIDSYYSVGKGDWLAGLILILFLGVIA